MKIRKVYINYRTFSLAFFLVGMPLVFILREYVPSQKILISYGVMGFILFSMLNYKHLLKIKLFNNKPILFLFLLIVNFSIFLLHLFSESKFSIGNIEAVSIFINIFIFLALSTNKNKDFSNLLIYVLIISTLTTFASLLFNTDTWMLTGRFYAGDSMNPNMSSFVALINILSIMYYFSIGNYTNIFLKLVSVLSIFLSFYIYIMSFSKSSILGMFAVIIFLFFAQKQIFLNFFKYFLLISLTSIPFVITFVPNFVDTMSANFSILSSAYDSYMYGYEGSRSAQVRHENLKEVMRILPEITWFEGKGIFTTRADLPFLQVFTDLGIIAGIINFLVTILIPLYIVIRVINVLPTYKNDSLYTLYLFTVMIFLFYFPNNLFHGTPYEYSIWLPILILYKFTPWEKRKVL